MFSRHHRKLRVIFGLSSNTRLTVLPLVIEQGRCARGAQPPCQGLSDLLLTAAAFEAAYLTRLRLGMPRVFFFDLSTSALLLGFSVLPYTALGICLVGFLAETPGPVPEGDGLPPDARRYLLEELPNMLQRKVIDEVLFAVDSGKLTELEEVFLLCDEEGVRTRVALDFFPHVNSTVYLERLGSLPLLTFSAVPTTRCVLC